MSNMLEKVDIGGAKLPRNYEAARQALESTQAIDECKDWADKAAALASYAKQACDDTLLNFAQRIQVRAVRRSGELLREIEPAGGERTDKPRRGAPPKLTRKAAADEAGLSADQRKNAIRIAGIPEDEFEEQVESDNPPTVTELAGRSRKKKDPDEEAIRAMYGDKAFDDNEAFRAGIQLGGTIKDLVKQLEKYPSIKRMVDTMNERARRDLRGNVYELRNKLDEMRDELTRVLDE